MTKLGTLQERVIAKICTRSDDERTLALVSDAVLATALELGYHINHAGEVCDPRPPPPSTPPQTGVRWSGGRSRPRGRR